MPDILRVVVVDDEKPARERLKSLLRLDARVELVASCGGGAEALERVRSAASVDRPVHLIFLDVQMPEVDGFAVIASLFREAARMGMPAIVFVTAHDAYALRAFDAHAVDYLLKPFGDERFQAALDRAIRHVRAGHAHVLVERLQELLGTLKPGAERDEASVAVPPPTPVLDRIVVKGPHRVRLLPVEQISWI